jgi:hypothetical protein
MKPLKPGTLVLLIRSSRPENTGASGTVKEYRPEGCPAGTAFAYRVEFTRQLVGRLATPSGFGAVSMSNVGWCDRPSLLPITPDPDVLAEPRTTDLPLTQPTETT